MDQIAQYIMRWFQNVLGYNTGPTAAIISFSLFLLLPSFFSNNMSPSSPPPPPSPSPLPPPSSPLHHLYLLPFITSAFSSISPLITRIRSPRPCQKKKKKTILTQCTTIHLHFQLLHHLNAPRSLKAHIHLPINFHKMAQLPSKISRAMNAHIFMEEIGPLHNSVHSKNLRFPLIITYKLSKKLVQISIESKTCIRSNSFNP